MTVAVSELRRAGVVLALLALVAACMPAASEPAAPVVVGGGTTDEQRLLAALTVVALQREGMTPEVEPGLGGTVALRREARRGNIDVFWDYTGAAWALGLGEQAPPADPAESYERVARADEDRHLVWLEPTAVNATLALFVRGDDLPATQPRGLTWLAGWLSSGEATLCADPDFVRRPGGLDALAEAYSIETDRLRVQPADEEEAISGVADGWCDVGLATATSGVARDLGLVPVADDLPAPLFPAFILAPVVRAATLEARPEVAAALEPVVELLDTGALAALNAEVAAGASHEQVAENFLAERLPPPAE